MSDMTAEAINYLAELYRVTEGDPGVQTSMFEVGTAIGMEKEAAGKMAEELIAMGHVEIRTLSGGIGITQQGIEIAIHDGGITAMSQPRLGDGDELDEDGRLTVESALNAIKNALGQHTTPFPQLETLVVDIKTIEIQMLSPQPKIAIIRAVFHSMQKTLTAMSMTEQALKIKEMIAA
jgi:hypothetical protein